MNLSSEVKGSELHPPTQAHNKASLIAFAFSIEENKFKTVSVKVAKMLEFHFLNPVLTILYVFFPAMKSYAG